MERFVTTALREYLINDAILREEIEGKIGSLNLEINTPESDKSGADKCDDNEGDDDDLDDSDVPSSVVIKEALGISVPHDAFDMQFCVASGTITDEKGNLHACGTPEDIWDMEHGEDGLEGNN